MARTDVKLQLNFWRICPKRSEGIQGRGWVSHGFNRHDDYFFHLLYSEKNFQQANEVVVQSTFN